MQLEHWTRHGIRLASMFHLDEYFTDFNGTVPENPQADIFTYWHRTWLDKPYESCSHPVLRQDSLAVLDPPKSYDDWYKSLDKRVRYAIRTKEAVALPCSAEIGLEILNQIYSEIRWRQGRPFHTGDFLRVVESQFFCAYADGRPVGAARVIVSPGRDFGILGSFISREGDFDKKPNDAMLSTIVRWAIREGIPRIIYDYMDGQGLGFFKWRHGFCAFPVNRYMIPLTWKGRIAAKMKWLIQ